MKHHHQYFYFFFYFFLMLLSQTEMSLLKNPPGMFKDKKPPKTKQNKKLWKYSMRYLYYWLFSDLFFSCGITIFFKSALSFLFPNSKSKAVQKISKDCLDAWLPCFNSQHSHWVSYNTLVWLAYLAIDISVLQKSQTVKYYHSVQRD